MPSNRSIVFVDTETTCLGHRARPWEIALIRRDKAGAESQLVVQVAYPLNGLPEGTDPDALHIGGWLTRGVRGSTWLEATLGSDVDFAIFDDEGEAAALVAESFRDEPILVGVGVHFDTAVLSNLFRRHSLNAEPWHYAIVDLKAATWGYLRARAKDVELSPELQAVSGLPVRSEAIAAALCVKPPADEDRHTALGDARWAARWFDALTGVAA